VSATIKEVARRAGVSIATVSRVLNNVGAVDERTRDLVSRAVVDLRYVPNPLGRGLSRQKTEAIGLLLPDLFGEFFSEVIRGADQTAQLNRHHLVVSSSHNSREEIAAAVRMMRGRVDGLLIMSPHIDANTLRENLPPHLPVILINAQVEGDDYDSLNVDNFAGAAAMVQHLLGHGHRRIALIKGSGDNLDALERLRGYRHALAEGGGECRAEYEIPGNFTEASGYDAVRKILQLDPRPTAIFACNDTTAIGAMSALREAGVPVPDEFAVAGFDDIPVCSYLTPSLSTVHVGINRVGVLAVETLLRALGERNAHRKEHRTIPTTLALRESCGCRDTTLGAVVSTAEGPDVIPLG
jgi:LacI family transcriptional regulator, galactose operon repressor